MTLQEIMDREIKQYAERYKSLREQGETKRYEVSLECYDFISKMTGNPELRIHYANMFCQLRK